MKSSLCFICLIVLLSGCHQSHTTNYMVKRVIHADSNGNSDTSDYSYDISGRIVHIQSTLGVSDFTFSGNSFVANRYALPAYSTGTLASGRIATLHSDSVDYLMGSLDYAYVYDSLGQMITVNYLRNGTIAAHSTYHWHDGNLDSIVDPDGRSQNYTYTMTPEFRDRSFSVASADRSILAGANILGKPNKNLISSQRYSYYSPGVISLYTYTFDSDGRVKTMTINGGPGGLVDVFTYFYQ